MERAEGRTERITSSGFSGFCLCCFVLGFCRIRFGKPRRFETKGREKERKRRIRGETAIQIKVKLSSVYLTRSVGTSARGTGGRGGAASRFVNILLTLTYTYIKIDPTTLHLHCPLPSLEGCSMTTISELDE